MVVRKLDPNYPHPNEWQQHDNNHHAKDQNKILKEKKKVGPKMRKWLH
jgi:hypothetical protein